MTAYVGDLRARLIRDSLYNMMKGSLTQRGWFDDNRRHLPINLIPKAMDWNDEIPLNTIALVMDTIQDTEAEMGSDLSDNRQVCYFDFYAESEDVGMGVAAEMKDIIRGKMPSIGRSRPVLDVLDYTMATPAVIFYCDIENVVQDRATGFAKPWMRYWFTVRFTLIDTYGDENDGD